MVGKRIFHTKVVAFVFGICATGVSLAHAETLSIQRDNISEAVTISVGETRALISEVGFAEVAIANPNIVGVQLNSDHGFDLSGLRSGRTTLTMLGGHGDVGLIAHIAIIVDHAETATSKPLDLPQLSPPETIQVVDNTATQTLAFGQSVSVILHSDVPFEGFDIDDTGVAMASMMVENTVFILGLNAGITTLRLHHANAQPDTVVNLQIEN